MEANSLLAHGLMLQLSAHTLALRALQRRRREGLSASAILSSIDCMAEMETRASSMPLLKSAWQAKMLQKKR